jgi:hypothetical protein
MESGERRYIGRMKERGNTNIAFCDVRRSANKINTLIHPRHLVVISSCRALGEDFFGHKNFHCRLGCSAGS